MKSIEKKKKNKLYRFIHITFLFDIDIYDDICIKTFLTESHHITISMLRETLIKLSSESLEFIIKFELIDQAFLWVTVYGKKHLLMFFIVNKMAFLKKIMLDQYSEPTKIRLIY